MHIMEGFLPSPWWIIWFVLAVPFIIYGIYQINKLVKQNREILPLLAVAGAYIFVLSSLKLPSVTGSCSHPTGTALGAIIFGPFVTAVLSFISLIYQALFLAHGGFTTLGANTFSMGIVGPIFGYIIYKALMKVKINFYIAAFFAATFADWFTYVMTSIQLALAFPAAEGGFMTSFASFATVFAVTQVPLALMEGVLTALLLKYVLQVRSDILVKMKVMPKETVKEVLGRGAKA
ncbi:MAG: energy-coupling factor ABC transporter permease [Candidatus Methanofastidiosa archaeon]|jgi:cobalt/nickel transport system permease protein|nr:energy-coupling factor ABC transporter permease [Candidatus Methanofastidiosa archaeon]HOM95308.1 energy-coupling factor ABC transporter permease [Methanofastidiosum sp.]HPC80759.1 energy-coupling factor ABC transporter permease [Methanofastidiosum sp.]HRS25105.1 energy-coupling factor ABC transporter permease [Methanofastidiosum sp.]